MGEDLGEGYARRVNINESTTLSPSPSPSERVASAFTLAEVLITLVIIGVIAAITVPSLINKTNNQEYVSRLKKAYSTLAQATNQIIADEGPVISWLTTNNDLYELYKKKLINAKVCDRGNGCFTQDEITAFNSSKHYWKAIDRNKLVLQDGTQILFNDSFNKTCSLDNNNDDGSKDVCTRFYVDINGAKKPNIIGKDIFAFVLKKNGLYPAGCDYDNLCNKNYLGLACACKVLREGAINY